MRINGISTFCGYRNAAVSNKFQRPANIRFGEEQKTNGQRIQELRKNIENYTEEMQGKNLNDADIYYLSFDRARALIELGSILGDPKEKLSSYQQAMLDLSEAKKHTDEREIKKVIESTQEVLSRKINKLL